MSLPASVTVVTVVGSFIDASGVPMAGTITFTPNVTVTIPGTTIALVPVSAELDPLGRFSLSLAATDDSDLSPAGWAYRVTISVGRKFRQFSVFLPSSPNPVNLDSLVPVSAVNPSKPFVFSVNHLGADSSGNVDLGVISAPVTSVAGKTGAVSLVKADVGLGAVDNTADTAKPVSTVQQTALNLKENTGVAAGLDAAHVAASDPHPGYARRAVLRQAYITSGNLQLNVGTNSWGPLTGGPTLSVPAVVGDYIDLSLTALRQANSNIFLDVGVLVGGSIVRYLATGSATPAGEGDPGLYHTALPARSGGRGFTVASGDLSAGNVVFSIAIRNTSGASSLLLAGTDNPLYWRATNHGPVI